MEAQLSRTGEDFEVRDSENLTCGCRVSAGSCH